VKTSHFTFDVDLRTGADRAGCTDRAYRHDCIRGVELHERRLAAMFRS
jgi:hypothetical protein